MPDLPVRLIREVRLGIAYVAVPAHLTTSRRSYYGDDLPLPAGVVYPLGSGLMLHAQTRPGHVQGTTCDYPGCPLNR